MTVYRFVWSQGGATVSTPAEAEAVLDRIAADQRGPFALHIVPADNGGQAGVELIWGDPDRAMLMYADATGGGWAIEPDMPPATHDLDYDHGSIEPERTRLSATAARKAIVEYVTTGKRPTGVTWTVGTN